MEIPNITPPPVPIPTKIVSPEFKKSLVFLILAYIQIIICVFPFIVSVIGGGSRGIFSLIFTVPALVIVFTKNQFAYRIARIFLILIFIIPLVIMGMLMLAFSGGGW